MANSTRRTFLAASTAAAVPFFIKAEKKSGAKLPIVGEGEHTYECIHDWGELPAHIKYGNTHNACEDLQGHIYIHHTVHATSQSPDSVVVFDSNGKFVRSWGAMFKGGAHGMQYGREGKDEFLYFCDDKHGFVTKRTLKGEEVWTLGYPQDSAPYRRNPGPGLLYRPTNLCLAPNGDFWVGDGYGSSYMLHYSGKGAYPKLLNTFGGLPEGVAPTRPPQTPGAAPPPRPPQAQTGAPPARPPEPTPANVPIDKLRTPHGNFVDTRDPASPVLLIADRSNNRIVRYTLDDKPIDVIGGIRSPCHFHQHKGVVVVPDLASRVTLLDKDNKVITHLGDGRGINPAGVRTTEDRANFIPGKFVAPHGAIFDHAGNIIVVEFVEIGRVTKLRKVA